MAKKPSTHMKSAVFLLSGLLFISSINLTLAHAIGDNYHIDYTHLLNHRANYSTSTEVISEINQVNGTKTGSIPGGPDQPEATGFTPIGVTDMVDPFTGDFQYNIPLMDIDGYPVNIAYTGDVGMNSESSWVGLGWSLNIGAVNRAMKGVPDDFDGTDRVKTTINTKTNISLSLGQGFDLESFGVEASAVGVSFSRNITYNNYLGFSTGFSISPEFTLFKSQRENDDFNTSLGLGLSIGANSQSGASINPSLSLKKKQGGQSAQEMYSNSLRIGAAYSTRTGLGQINYGFSRSKSEMKSARFQTVGSGSVNSSFDLGQPTYFPSSPSEKLNVGLNFSFKVAPDASGVDPNVTINGSLNVGDEKNRHYSNPSYGALYHYLGQNDENAILDFNRENDGAFTKSKASISIPNKTNDIFQVSGNGVGGSYIIQNQYIPTFHDPKKVSNGISASLGLEFAVGFLLKGGIDVSGSYSKNESGPWREGNSALTTYGSEDEEILLRNANEMSVIDNIENYEAMGGDLPIRLEINSATSSLGNTFTTDKNTLGSIPTQISGFQRSNDILRITKNEQLRKGYASSQIVQLFQNNNADGYRKDHHIGMMTMINSEGRVYKYGLASYNTKEIQYTFAVGTSLIGNMALIPEGTYDITNKQTDYSGTSHAFNIANNYGIDNLYNRKETPAYVHSYLLTEVLSADYIDNDNISGPSINDYGSYYLFDYKFEGIHKWRNPAGENKASFNDGLYGQQNDDKANISYGEKELWYLKSIKSKNQIAIFYTSDKKDGYGVIDSTGTLDFPTSSNASQFAVQQQLDSIKLFNLNDFTNNGSNAIPIKSVYFVYDNSLCKNYINNVNQTGSNSGKLTLKEIKFTYENSAKGRYNSYQFEYYNNANYNPLLVDGWGNYKPWSSTNNIYSLVDNPLHPNDFPSVNQQKPDQDENASQWMLSKITLPSSGIIEIEYESDDYAYVQNKRTMQMFKIAGYYRDGSATLGNVEIDLEPSDQLVVELGDANDPKISNDPEHFIKGIDQLFFKALAKFEKGTDRYDFVPGWTEIVNASSAAIFTENDKKYLRFNLKTEQTGGLLSSDINPISLASINYARMYLSSYLPPSSQDLDNGNILSNIVDVINAMVGQFVVLGEIATGPNKNLYGKNIGRKFIKDKSFVRLYSSNPNKLGGGTRVKKITMSDNWGGMTNGSSKKYGQTYKYVTEEGISSGVATYEPQALAEENPFTQPVFSTIEHLLAPDEINYQLMPFGQAHFPSAQVGYSRVEIESLTYSNLSNPSQVVSKNSTGKVVNEYYTAKDFPTISRHTYLSPAYGSIQNDKLLIPALFFNSAKNFMKVSQGFVVENNDMNGKPKANFVYEENNNDPISKVEYFYQCESIAVRNSLQKLPEGFIIPQCYRLTNKVQSINPKGEIKSSIIGLKYDLSMDFRESKSRAYSGTLQTNVNLLAPFILVPIPLGSYSQEKTDFRSASVMKTINRFGILERTVATDLGSQVETENLAYDSETGKVLVTKTRTNFEDALYTLDIPAHWYYGDMGHAYKSENFKKKFSFIGGYNVSNGLISGIGTNDNLHIGDHLFITPVSGSGIDVWVDQVSNSTIKVSGDNGQPVNIAIRQIDMIRSAYENTPGVSIGSIISRENPITHIKNNSYESVLQASAIEFTDDWQASCACKIGNGGYLNPYYTGERGRWIPKASYSFLTNRNQTFENNNSDIRNDGFFESFNPFYQINNTKWSINKGNWTFASEIETVNSMGQALETRDALNRYTATLYRYNNTLASGVAVNSRKRQIGEESFEDFYSTNCDRSGFGFDNAVNHISTERSHSGKTSIKVGSGNSNVIMVRELDNGCETAECNIQIEKTYVNFGSYSVYKFQVSNYQESFTWELNLTYGGESYEETFDPVTKTIEIKITNTDSTQGEIIVTDNAGCTAIKDFK
jgi:hypothetical protein